MSDKCLRCKINAVYIFDSGENNGLCKACHDMNCLGCGKRPMHVFADGQKCGLCAECGLKALDELMFGNHILDVHCNFLAVDFGA